jgi:hypothetical protein
MIDMHTHRPIRVSTDGTSGPYLMVPADQVEQVRKVLEANSIPCWVEHYAISVDGRPAMVVINIATKNDPRHVQAILDSAT